MGSQVGRHLTFPDPQLEESYLLHFTTQQVPVDGVLFKMDVFIQLALALVLHRCGATLAAVVPTFFMLVDITCVWQITMHRPAYARKREQFLRLLQPMYFLEAHVAMRHGILFATCSSRTAFWLLHLISSALLYQLFLPLGMPVRFRSMLPAQVLQLGPILYSNSCRCEVMFASCPNSPAWYEQAASLLTQLCIATLPFPTALEPLAGKAACVGVHCAAQIVLGFCVVARLLERLERRRRAAFARAAGNREAYMALLRRRKKMLLSVLDYYIVFITVWQVQSLVLPKLFPLSVLVKE